MAPLLEIEDLTVEFRSRAATVHAVNGVSYSVHEGETLGIVGESGSGKSAHAMALLGLLPSPPARITRGSALFRGSDILHLSRSDLRSVRGREIGFVFQDPMTSLHPMLRIGTQITEALLKHTDFSRSQAEARAAELLDLVRIPNAADRLSQYPHEFSGGMRQRVMIAIALSCNPKLLIADEPTTALDVTVQAQILEIIRDLKTELGMAVIWITHDLSVVAEIADTVQVMYGGRILERGPVADVFANPRNAYTYGLLQSLPQNAEPNQKRLMQIEGSPPDLTALPAGDPFQPRNPYATDRCRREVPPLRQVEGGAPGHVVAAWYDLPSALKAEGRQ